MARARSVGPSSRLRDLEDAFELEAAREDKKMYQQMQFGKPEHMGHYFEWKRASLLAIVRHSDYPKQVMSFMEQCEQFQDWKDIPEDEDFPLLSRVLAQKLPQCV